nr:ribonuclease H-like domain-containing protein [Tanacetum cinerariifolium]
IKLLKLDVQFRDNVLVELRKKFEQAEQERDELKLKLDKFQTSSKNLSQLLASQTFNKTGLGYDNQVINSTVFDCDEMFSFESDVSMPTSPVYARYKSREGYHAIPPPYTGTFMPPKPNLVFHDAPTINETISTTFNVEPSPTKPDMDLSQSNRPFAPIIGDWVSDSEYESEAARHVTTVVPQTKVQHQRPTKHGVTKEYSPKIRPINRRQSPPTSNFLQQVTIAKAPQVNVVKGVKGNWGGKVTGKGKIKTHKLDFDDVYFVKELKFNLFSVLRMYDKKNSVLFMDTECIVLSSNFKLPDENHVLLRVPKENNMYNVDLKNIVPSGDLTCLFAKATLDESNLWHRRLGHINFKTMNKLELASPKANEVLAIPRQTATDVGKGFEQILDFLNASVIQRKVIITEDTVRQALRLDDAKSIDCLPNEEIFVELERMGYEKPLIKLTFYKAFFSA